MNSYKMRGAWLLAFLVAGLLFMAAVLPAAAAVTVYAEGAYTDSDLVVYIYADITTDAICSAGIKLSYDNTVLTVASAEKNDAVWFMGAGGPDHSYMNPEDAGDGVIVICGKLDTNNPTVGVIGDRVLLGKVTFTRKVDFSMPGVNDPEGFFGISVGLGRDEPFANFVTTGAVELDADADPVPSEPVAFTGATVRERGDANGDGNINVADYIAIRNNINATIFPPYMDCNVDGAINVADYICVRNKI